MQKYLFFLFSMLLFSSCLTTRNTASPYYNKYKSFLQPDEKEIISKYNYVITQNSKGQYIYRVFYPERNILTNYITFTNDINRRIKHGPYMEYSDWGVLLLEGNYNYNKKEGLWKSYDRKTKLLLSEGSYSKGEKVGVWKDYDNQKRLRSVYNYTSDKKDGEFIIYDSLSNITIQGIYKADELVRADTLIHEEKIILPTADDTNERMPMFFSNKCQMEDYETKKKCSDREMLQFIYKNIKYPRDARMKEVEGKAIVKFVVEKDGSISNIEVIKGICESISKEVQRIIKSMPPWIPGEQNGKKVRVQFNIPIKFKFQ